MISHVQTRARIAPRELGEPRDAEQPRWPTFADLLLAEARALTEGRHGAAEALGAFKNARLRMAARS